MQPRIWIKSPISRIQENVQYDGFDPSLILQTHHRSRIGPSLSRWWVFFVSKIISWMQELLCLFWMARNSFSSFKVRWDIPKSGTRFYLTPDKFVQKGIKAHALFDYCVEKHSTSWTWNGELILSHTALNIVDLWMEFLDFTPFCGPLLWDVFNHTQPGGPGMKGYRPFAATTSGKCFLIEDSQSTSTIRRKRSKIFVAQAITVSSRFGCRPGAFRSNTRPRNSSTSWRTRSSTPRRSYCIPKRPMQSLLLSDGHPSGVRSLTANGAGSQP